MTTSRLKIVHDRVVLQEEDAQPPVEVIAEEAIAEDEPPRPLRETVRDSMAERQEYIKDKCAKWIAFYGDIGRTKLCLDLFPLPITYRDMEMLKQWLVAEHSLKVERKWYFGKTWIYLDQSAG